MESSEVTMPVKEVEEVVMPQVSQSSVKTVIVASMIGTAVEFFDFYAYGTASAAYFPKVFFPQMTPVLATVLSLLTFGVAFVARSGVIFIWTFW